MSADKSGGLAGVVAGETGICTVGKAGLGLTYRGYSINDLAEHAQFEEVAFLLLHGHLPSRAELDAYSARLISQRRLPKELRTVLEQLPATAHPMDVLRTGCSTLGCLEPEGPDHAALAVANRLLASFPSMLLYWHQFAQNGKRIETQTDDPSMAAHFLHLLLGQPAEAGRVAALNTSLVKWSASISSTARVRRRPRGSFSAAAASSAPRFSVRCSTAATTRAFLVGKWCS